MNHKIPESILALMLLAVWPATGLAQQTNWPEPSQKTAGEEPIAGIVVIGKKLSDVDERRYSTAAKMVFGREELDRYGDSSIGEVLKRLPGVTVSGTPGRGGDIRMRGLGKGYTMILLNGEPMPHGFSLDSLPPDQVERVEVMRAPVAEHSARAIAGTINIVLREQFAKRNNDFRPSLGWENGYFQPGVSVQRNDNFAGVNYNIAATVLHRSLANDSATYTRITDFTGTMPVVTQTQQDRGRTVSDGLHANARLNWRLGDGDSFSFQPFLMRWQRDSTGITTLTQAGGGVQPYARADWRTNAETTVARGMGNWKTRLGDGRLDVRFNGGRSLSGSETDKRQWAVSGDPLHVLRSVDDVSDSNFSTAGKYSRAIDDRQQLAAGWEFDWSRRRETVNNREDGLDPLAAYGGRTEVRTRRIAGYIQDEWNLTPLWSIYGGIRWEGIRTRSGSGVGWTENTSSVVSPLFHSVWRFTEQSKDQVRLGLTRSYRSPTLGNLTAIPTLSSNYPASGGNTATSPDTIGNPGLKPELAWGLDLAFEHYFAGGGLLSASLFRRYIDDLIRDVTRLRTVDWSSRQRWVSAPENIGHATSHGVELEGKFRLDEVIKDALPLDLRLNYSRFWSDVDSVPGPDNRLDQQPKQTANIGLDYRVRTRPLTLGGNIGWTPAYSVRENDTQRYYQGMKRVFDAYVLWRFDAATQLRVSASNLTHADYRSADSHVLADTAQTAETVRKTFASVTARLEIKF